jgi:hypothetical protein
VTAAVPLSVSRRTKNDVAYFADTLLTPFPVTQATEAMNKAIKMLLVLLRTTVRDCGRASLGV